MSMRERPQIESQEDSSLLGAKRLTQELMGFPEEYRTLDGIRFTLEGEDLDSRISSQCEDFLESLGQINTESDLFAFLDQEALFLSDLAVLTMDESMIDLFQRNIDRIATKLGKTSAEAMTDYFTVLIPARVIISPANHQSIHQYSIATPKNSTEYWQNRRLAAYGRLRRGDDILAHGTQHVHQILEDRAVRPKTRHDKGKVTRTTGGLGDASTASSRKELWDSGGHSVLTHFASSHLREERLPGLQFGSVNFYYSRQDIMTHSSIDMEGEEEASLEFGSERNQYAAIVLDPESIANSGPIIKEVLNWGGPISDDESFGCSFNDVNKTGDYEYPVEDSIMFFKELVVVKKLLRELGVVDFQPLETDNDELSVYQRLLRDALVVYGYDKTWVEQSVFIGSPRDRAMITTLKEAFSKKQSKHADQASTYFVQVERASLSYDQTDLNKVVPYV